MELTSYLQPAPLSTVHARRICLIKPSSLGDVIQSLPILAALRCRFPRAKISWVVNSSYVSLIEPVEGLDEVIPFERDHFRSVGVGSLNRLRAFLKDLHAKHFDLVVDLQGLFRSGLMTWASGASLRIGLASSREGASLSYTHVVNDLPKQQPAVARYWRVAELLGVGHWPKTFPLGISVEEQARAKELLDGLPGPLLALNPGSRWDTKRWPAERFAEAANRYFGDRPGSCVVLGAPDEVDVAERLVAKLDRPHRNLAGKTSLRELVAILDACDVMLTNDSGPMHVAAAVGTPTVSVFTCTSPERAAPFGGGHRVVQTSVDCRASYLRQCDRLDCMKDLTTDRVLPILQGIDLPSRSAPLSRDEAA
ncbi:ADP-heptose--LPS heptosyltransferase 2 [Planctomycetes bacterium Pan216]|uniref:lipopolysaccharide heptosyltransferase II n=1 Tax=Kolteria novifilia TaxID=2527975 RepID=A0A518B498_9BACT|nr:ADP-heptose--LPS heptosyltransferase 2 [Planctomycetes bacterium Pan216]